MNQMQNTLLADLIIDGKNSKESGLYISEMTFNEGISRVSKAVLTICSNSLCLKLRGKKDQNGNQTEKGLLDYLDKKATICFLGKEKVSRTFTGKITSVTHLGVSNTISGNIYKYEFIVEATIADMKLSHHTRQIKKTINDAIKEILSSYNSDAAIDFVETAPDPNIYLFYQQNETDYDFFLRLLAQFGLSFFISSQKNLSSDEYYEHVTISDGKSFELPVEARLENSHTDRNLNILVNKSSKTKSGNIRISSWQMTNSTAIDEICRTDSLKNQENNKRLWFLNSLATPHSETQTDEKTRDKIAGNYLDSIRSSSANWFGVAHLNDFQATDILNIFDFYSPCNLDSEEKEKSALLSEDTIRARIISLNLLLTNVLPFETGSSTLSPSAEVKFRCAEISKEAPSTFTSFAAETTLSPMISASYSQTASIQNSTEVPVANNNLDVLSGSNGGADVGLSIKKATVCYPPTISAKDLVALPKKNAKAQINIDQNTGECFFYAKIDNSTNCSEVLFTMPVAGCGQGLYRYPRIGERILVLDNKDSRYILLSYLPDTNTMPFFEYGKLPSDDEIESILKAKDELNGLTEDKKKEKIKNYKDKLSAILANQKEEQSVATVLRHSSGNFMNGTTEADITDYLSEESLGQFTARLKPLKREVDGSFNATDYQKKDIKYSEIGMYSGFNDNQKWIPETLRIQTPGNQFNHTGLLNLNTANNFVFTTPNATQKDSGFGSFKVIDVGSVIIDASKSITLKVAGNIVTINEKGVNIISQSTCTENTPYDSVLSLSPIGASLSGLEVNVAGTISTNVSGGLSAGVSLEKGAVAINGHTVDLSTVDHSGANFDIFLYCFDVAKYTARFIADQVNMKKWLDTGYNDMVKDGYFNSDLLDYRMTGGKSDALKNGLATYNATWNFIVTIAKTVYLFKSLYPPLRGKLSVYIAGITVNLLFGIFDSVMALLSDDVYKVGALKSLTPEQVQRQITITNFIKVATKSTFVLMKLASIKSYKAGDISYLMMDPEEIKSFSSSLKTDFAKVSATAHNVPLNPFLSSRCDGLPALKAIPNGPVRAAQKNLTRALGGVADAGSAAAFGALMTASSLAPAFTLKSDNGSVGLDSKALKEFKTEILTGLAKVSVTSPKVDFNTSGRLNVSSLLGTKISCVNNTIEIVPAAIKITGALLDMRITTLLKMNSDAALNLKGASINVDGKITGIKSPVINVTGQLVKVG